MMKELLENWPMVILFQGLGVALALGADVVTWKWRRYEKTVFAVNLSLLVIVIPYFGMWIQSKLIWALFFVLLWLFLVSCVQMRQFEITLRAAFFAVLMQLLCFGFAWGCVLLFLFLVALGSSGDLWLLLWVWAFSSLAAYFMLSLFRPSLFGFWRLLRGYF